MAMTVKKVSGKGKVTMAGMLKQFQKDLGESVGSFGGVLPSTDRVPTGLFPLDLALGGGFPRGKCSIVYGPESSNKSNIIFRAIAMHQLLWPEKINVFVDVEHSFDPKWASLLGVDVEKLIVISPGYAEQIVDLVEGFVDSSDCGIVAIDSIAAMMTTSEGEASAERANVGGATSAVTKLYRKMVKCLGDAERDQRFPTLIYVNQTRYKIGVMFGDPETMPGGNAIRFQAGLWLRVYGKNEMDPTVSSVMPVRKKVSFIVKKWKYPILSVSGNFEMATMPHNGLVVGQCDDFNLIKTYLQTFDMFNKDDKKGWNIFGEHYDTIQPFKDRIFDDKVFGEKIRQTIIDRMLKHGSLLTGGETP